MTIIAWAPLDSGILTGKFHDPRRFNQPPIARRMMLRRHLESSLSLIRALSEIAIRYDATLAQIALNWLLCCQGEAVVAIPSASDVHHAQQNAEAMNFLLSDDEMTYLDQASHQFLL